MGSYDAGMCYSDGHADAAAPRPADAPVVDPIRLDPVDEVTVVTLVDNVHDALLPGDERVSRVGFVPGRESMGQFLEPAAAFDGLRAEHGFGTLVTIRRGDRLSRIVFDTGLSPRAMVDNADRMGIDLADVSALVMSHGHFDHAGGLIGISRRLGRRTPMVIHPFAWTRRRLLTPGNEAEMPTLSRTALEREGFEVIERRQPSLLLDGALLVTGEVDRTTDFERGMPAPHQAWDGQAWVHDPAVIDDQAVVVHVRGQGLVVVTGCGHAGVVNIVRHAMRLTAVERLAGLVGGFHLSAPAFLPIIEPTVAALRDWAPDLVVPGHCTGPWAQQAIAAALPDAWRPGSSGSAYRWAA